MNQEYSERQELISYGNVTTAIVTRKSPPIRSSRKTYLNAWEVYYEYTLPQYPGYSFIGVERMTFARYEKLNLNSEVVITYNRKHPRQSYLGDKRNFPISGLFDIADIMMTVAVLPVALCGLISLAYRRIFHKI